MAYAKHTIEEHDVVRFRGPVDHWPAGTSGTVINAYPGEMPDEMLVEIVCRATGYTLDLVDVPVELLEVTHPQGRPAAA
jgi:hypothetical protein